MDDILVPAAIRWQLWVVVKRVNQVLSTLKPRKHPDKTYIGRTEKDLDWLDYHISPVVRGLASPTFPNFATRLTRLYEQEIAWRLLL